MRDLYASDALGADNSDVTAQFGGPGMRHSIRPRRTVIDHEDEFDGDFSEGDLTFEDSLPAAPAVSRYIGDDRAPRWQDLPIATPGPGGDMPLVDDHRNSAAARAFDLLRTRLRQTTLEHRWLNIAITAPTSGCGNSFSATNLALSLSRVPGSRTVLMDMNMRSPGLARAFDMQAPGAMSDLLSGRADLGKGMLRVSDTLALGLNDRAEVNAAEILQDSATAETLLRLRASLQPEIVLYDMPPMLEHDDLSAFLPQLDGVLLISDGSQTMARHLRECERMLEGQVPLLGIVLNRARASSLPKYA
ncbi:MULTISPECIES: CpsD/CapB family tyrosine-protein kinase [unclassified Sulfitobacter]|uniref:CpsD/CapB family tyrosine-protein kinase n=1 Tax=unclassified Sulfitobacter TaxID=196795 RepID=UPI0023E2996C|nr:MULTISPECIES: CpsD/CapB family tyrosine-protein kinase [unclassified Sulfitobacter]MDF3382641.1 CpsD/CapB family tyrosine-protein kinase [Sulfitobacter sp. Ks11]MDF3386060.1 CpsD/CapB family tyrosine-protein kinase [Sulfitobacter sp. M85]MDF3389479.1 CpsD/CapB family tyrosine-protein kinase [Sulfitobacter sp. Ks16]MDF3400116.1 CpsD/CapB family tyrosine-protein kinase [Sulfitobacter sp. KE39]MDF3403537.1 CpsD/CapB family tyrosine-protein kinase [Sulfitobacter sp. Ks35]